MQREDEHVMLSRASKGEFALKKIALLIMLILMLTMAFPTYAEPWIENLVVENVTIYMGESTVQTTESDCPHVNLYQISENQTRCLYVDSSSHIIYVFHQIKCSDCDDFIREVTVSETIENHNYEIFDDFCDAVNMTHTYWKRCSGCQNETRTSVFCRGVHTEIMQAICADDLGE